MVWLESQAKIFRLHYYDREKVKRLVFPILGYVAPCRLALDAALHKGGISGLGLKSKDVDMIKALCRMAIPQGSALVIGTFFFCTCKISLSNSFGVQCLHKEGTLEGYTGFTDISFTPFNGQ